MCVRRPIYRSNTCGDVVGGLVRAADRPAAASGPGPAPAPAPHGWFPSLEPLSSRTCNYTYSVNTSPVNYTFINTNYYNINFDNIKL